MIIVLIGSKVRLTKINSNHSYLRTDEVIGTLVSFPIVGSRFSMKAESLDKTKDFRWVETTEIISIEKQEDDSYKFTTKNSEYRLEILEY